MTIDKLDPKGLEALKRLVKTANLLHQNSICCAMDHYGDAHALHGLPGWLLDAESDIIAGQEAVEALASTAGVPGETPRVTAAMVETAMAAMSDHTGVTVMGSGFAYAMRAALEAAASLSSPPVSQQASDEIADKVLSWMVEHDLLDAGNEYQASDVLAVLDDLKPTETPVSQQAAVAAKPIGYAIADYFEDRRAEYEQNGTVIYAAPAGMATTPVYLSASPAPDAVEPVAWVRMKTLDPSKPLKATTIKDIADGWMKAGHKVKPLVIRSALHTSPVSAPGVVERPANCRNRLRDEGKAYPKSGCASCHTGGLTGCPHERSPAVVEGK